MHITYYITHSRSTHVTTFYNRNVGKAIGGTVLVTLGC